MEVNGVGGQVPLQSVRRPAEGTRTAAQSDVDRMAPQDQVEISATARELAELDTTDPVRAERLSQIRAAIDDGTYENPARLEAAVERMIDDIERES
ncbi:flagellar biosynthesis anti-sigma factor FlgM [Stratiformator vulcanicus]|uniref:Negative regulator of flagellin synthesis n=1 Tax=Stratiformator vulcanicus TaxID=2527980 RepID=A0A517R630_9PLAN|nr:flagellar biosynthesis anti-sigma factor FlgM [Stratiformator vulcanicus]QDT39319.1 Anti-sigma-28 factor, FlgM [Stratiformator vulcanicus]